jgi:hypothetical protein
MEEAGELYDTFMGDQAWLPSPKGDSGIERFKTPSGNYCVSAAEMNVLVQTLSNQTCFNCGKTGHMKKDCPSPIKPTGTQNQQAPSDTTPATTPERRARNDNRHISLHQQHDECKTTTGQNNKNLRMLFVDMAMLNVKNASPG